MHLRPPVYSHGFTSFLWGLGLGLIAGLALSALLRSRAFFLSEAQHESNAA